MLKRLLFGVLAMLLVTGCAVANDIYLDPTGKPKGFRGIEWGQSIETLKDMQLVGIYNEYALYTRKNDKLSMGNASLARITYLFIKNKFASVSIISVGEDNAKLLFAATKAALGDKFRKYGNSYAWIFYKIAIFIRITHILKLQHSCVNLFMMKSGIFENLLMGNKVCLYMFWDGFGARSSLLALLIVVMSSICSFAAFREPKDFHGYVWGRSIEEFSGMRLIEESKNLALYERYYEKLRFADTDASLKRVRYVFYNGKFAAVNIWAEDAVNAKVDTIGAERTSRNAGNIEELSRLLRVAFSYRHHRL